MVIKTDCRNGILLEGAISYRFDQSGFTRILKPDDSYLEFLVEEFWLDPSQDFIHERKHFYLFGPYPKQKVIIIIENSFKFIDFISH